MTENNNKDQNRWRSTWLSLIPRPSYVFAWVGNEGMLRCLLDTVHTYFCDGTLHTAVSARTELWLPQVLKFAEIYRNTMVDIQVISLFTCKWLQSQWHRFLTYPIGREIMTIICSIRRRYMLCFQSNVSHKQYFKCRRRIQWRMEPRMERVEALLAEP